MTTTTTCVALDEGVECATKAVMLRPVPLCNSHRMQVALLVVPELLVTSIAAESGSQGAKALSPEERNALVDGARPVSKGDYFPGVHAPAVYFIENGGRIKIGHSTNVRSRVLALSLQSKNVLLLLQGGPTLERALHLNFADDRVDSTEWFNASPAILEYITGKAALLAEVMFQAEGAGGRADYVEDLVIEVPRPVQVPTVVMREVTAYPDGTPMPESRKILWDAVAEFPAGFTYRDVVALDLPGYVARSSIQTPLDHWRARGWVEKVNKRGNASVFVLRSAAAKLDGQS